MPSEPVVIRLQDVAQRYRVISERPDTLRELFARFFRHKTSFHDFDALKNVSFSVRRGEVVGIIGRNGSGKSTTLKIVAGVYRPTAGQVDVNGTVAPLIELGAGFHPELTGRENILVNGLLMGYSKREMLSRQERIIEFAGIGDFIDAPVKQYSSGMYVRLAFAVATEVEPDILVIDEILSVGDLGFQKKCFDRLKYFRDVGKTILMVTHSMTDILAHCDRAIYLEKGQILFDGDPKQAVALYQNQSLRPEPRVIHGVESAAVRISAPAALAVSGKENSRSITATVLLEEQPPIVDPPAAPPEPPVEHRDSSTTPPPVQPPSNRVRNLDSSIRALARRISTPEFIEFDRWAIWFYALCLAVFLLASLADLNGSSMNVFPEVLHHGIASPPVAGSVRPIRMDEWAVHTPTILNQALRAHKFEFESSPLGNHSVALLGNIPVAHFSTIFRPQFWAFFVLPVGYAFAVYWQFKALLLLTGVFTWLLLLTRSTFWSIAGALWFFFSPYMQWSYSWPSLLPEMVGLLCFTMVFACYLTIGRNPLALAFAALAGAACAINFGMCAYPPHLIPLAWLAIFFFAGWCIAKRKLIFRKEQALMRILCATAGLALVAIVGIVVYADVRTAIQAIANTVYPGKRLFPPQTMELQFYLAHFMNWWMTPLHVPPRTPNISEASGFLWLAPVTLFCIARMAASTFQKLAFAALWCFSALMLAWLILPFPVAIAHFMQLTLTGGSRPTLALGLANIAIVALCMVSMIRRRPDQTPVRKPAALLGRVLGIFTLIFVILFLADETSNGFFSIGEISFAAAFTTLLAMLMLEGRKVLLAAALVIPSAFAFGSVNPLGRGVKVFTSSNLYNFVRSNNDLRNSEWIVFSSDMHASEFLTGVGCPVYNALRYVPDTDHFALFQSKGYSLQLLNADAHLIVRPIDINAKASLQPAGFATLIWNVSPSDPILKQLGIKYAAFAEQPPPAVAASLIPLSKQPVDNFWLYRLP